MFFFQPSVKKIQPALRAGYSEALMTASRHGELYRGDAQIVLKTSERTARNTLKQLTTAGFLTSPSPKTPVRLAFPLDYRERLFPNLFADADLPA